MTVEAAHDRFMAAAARFRSEPTFANAAAAIAAYRGFYVEFVGLGGVDEATAELRRRLAKSMRPASSAGPYRKRA